MLAIEDVLQLIEQFLGDLPNVFSPTMETGGKLRKEIGNCCKFKCGFTVPFVPMMGAVVENPYKYGKFVG